MKIASVADVKAKLSAYLRGSQEGPVVVTRNGKPVGGSCCPWKTKKNWSGYYLLIHPVCERFFWPPEIRYNPLEASHTGNSGRKWKRKYQQIGKKEFLGILLDITLRRDILQTSESRTLYKLPLGNGVCDKLSLDIIKENTNPHNIQHPTRYGVGCCQILYYRVSKIGF